MKPSQPSGTRILLLCLLAVGVLSLNSCNTMLGDSSNGGMAVGTWVARLPSGAERIEYKGMTLFRYGPDYFVGREGRFVVVRSPQSTLSAKRSMVHRL
jgi:predicted small secreted protein